MKFLHHKIKLFSIGLIIICFSISCLGSMVSRSNNQSSLSQSQNRPRIVCTTDPECDDQNSLVRFLLHSTDYDIVGLVYASSQYHWKGDGQGTTWFVEGREYTRYGLDYGPMESWRWFDGEGHIDQVVDAYEQAYLNLKVHNPDYPTPEYLRSIIRYGNIEFDGVFEKDTPGSDMIKRLILDDVPGPLYITAWGGQSTIARALKSIEDQYKDKPQWDRIREKITNKVIILPSGDQDNTGANYIRPNWPELYQSMRGGNRMGLGYGAQSRQSEYSFYYTSEFMQEHVSSKGPMGEVYRVWGDGKGLVENDIFDYFGLSGYTDEQLTEMGYIVWTSVQEKGSWLGEGDTGTFLNMLDFGLRNIEDPSYGGVGGYQAATSDGSVPMRGMFGGFGGRRGQGASGPGYPDFSRVIQNDFLERLNWCVTPEYENANHPPIVNIDGPLDITARTGQEVRLSGSVAEPDEDPVSIRWWQFQIVDSYEGEVTAANPTSASTTIVVPEDAEPGQTIHMILEATDNAPLPLTRYQRVIITVAQ